MDVATGHAQPVPPLCGLLDAVLQRGDLAATERRIDAREEGERLGARLGQGAGELLLDACDQRTTMSPQEA